MDHDLDIRYEAEDVAAPWGRCFLCRSPFGMKGKDGFVVYKAYSNECNICTMCVDFEDRAASRRYDYDDERRRR